MNMKGVVFDIGQTLVYYPVPLNWSALYRPAFQSISEKNHIDISEDEYAHIGHVLAKYNTRINPREEEVTSDQIFTEILTGTKIGPEYLETIKRDFYSFFKTDVRIYDEVPEVLKTVKSRGIMTATFSDVAYGMDNVYALEDIREVISFIDIPFTSNDAGFRKPNAKGLFMLADKMNIKASELLFVGDERKDIECAINAGSVSVLINRDPEEKNYGQDYTIKNLAELPEIL